MPHVVISEEKECPRCKKLHAGSAYYLFERYVCTDCFYIHFAKDLQPKIDELIKGYFNINED